jgi:hypothetical protein
MMKRLASFGKHFFFICFHFLEKKIKHPFKIITKFIQKKFNVHSPKGLIDVKRLDGKLMEGLLLNSRKSY